MTVTHVEKDFDSLTLTLIAEFDAPPEQVWQLWADPRLLERWWGPPGHPATVERHDLTPGGEVAYAIAGPKGKAARGWWRITSVDPPTSLEFVDGWADQDGTPDPSRPDHGDPGPAHRARRWHEDGDPLRVRVQGPHGADRRDGRARSAAAGRRPDGRVARRLTAPPDEPRARRPGSRAIGCAEAARCRATRPASAARPRRRPPRPPRAALGAGVGGTGASVAVGDVLAGSSGPLAPGSLSASPARLALSLMLPGPLAMSLSSCASSFRLSVPPRLSIRCFALRCRFLKSMEPPGSRVVPGTMASRADVQESGG